MINIKMDFILTSAIIFMLPSCVFSDNHNFTKKEDLSYKMNLCAKQLYGDNYNTRSKNDQIFGIEYGNKYKINSIVVVKTGRISRLFIKKTPESIIDLNGSYFLVKCGHASGDSTIKVTFPALTQGAKEEFPQSELGKVLIDGQLVSLSVIGSSVVKIDNLENGLTVPAVPAQTLTPDQTPGAE